MTGSWSVLLPKAIYGPMALQQQGCVATQGKQMSMFWAATRNMLMSVGCAEPVPSLIWASWKSWSWERHESKRADTTP